MTGDNAADSIAQLYEDYEDALLRYALRLSHDRDWAEDLVQDTFVRAMGHLELLRMLKRHERRAWLYQTLKHRFLDQQRTWQRRQEIQQELAILSDSSTDQAGLSLSPESVRSRAGAIPRTGPHAIRARYEQHGDRRRAGPARGDRALSTAPCYEAPAATEIPTGIGDHDD